MKKLIFAVFFITSVFGLSAYGQNDTPLVSKEGGFSFIPPAGFGKFQFSKQTDSAEAGGKTHYDYEESLDRGYMLISYFDLGVNLVDSARIQKVLDGGRDGAVRGSSATLDSQENITVDGFPALSFIIHATDKDKITSYARTVEIVAGSKMYSFLLVTPTAPDLTKPDVQKFFSSIHIQKQ